jgi:hypothetical protein
MAHSPRFMSPLSPHLHKDEGNPEYFEPYIEKKVLPVFPSKRIRA